MSALGSICNWFSGLTTSSASSDRGEENQAVEGSQGDSPQPISPQNLSPTILNCSPGAVPTGSSGVYTRCGDRWVSVVTKQPANAKPVSPATVSQPKTFPSVASRQSGILGALLLGLSGGQDVAEFCAAVLGSASHASGGVGGSCEHKALRDHLKSCSPKEAKRFLEAVLGMKNASSHSSKLSSTFCTQYGLPLSEGRGSQSGAVSQMMGILEFLNKKYLDASCGGCCPDKRSQNPLTGPFGKAGVGVSQLLWRCANNHSSAASDCCSAVAEHCQAPFGYPWLGCSNGEGGCGRLGKALCSCADSCDPSSEPFTINSYTAHLYEKLEQTFGSEVMLFALSKLGVNVHDLLLGISVEIPSLHSLEESCIEIVCELESLQCRMTQIKLYQEFASAPELLQANSFWKTRIIQALGRKTPLCSLEELGEKILVSDRSGKRSSFNLEKLLKTLFRTQIVSVSGERSLMDAQQIFVVISQVFSILSHALRNGEESLTLTTSELLQLCCICMAVSKYSLAGAPSCETQLFGWLRQELCDEQIRFERSRVSTSQSSVETSSGIREQLLARIALFGAGNTLQNQTAAFRDPMSEENRRLLRECLVGWAGVVGVCLKK
ncbi:hypothetical protein Q499_0114 [Chlamydia suis MD56]|uniref:hypothetical protein n=1 Tax=Chlamydia suis TaxID=83559 RepID=UPI0003BFF87B|nr:hypothetical protein [Chlamydia suis]ESN89662.1 hypothetical protein Q499_0114 [Chlamydia suis MD56]